MYSMNNVLAASVVALFAATAQGHMVMATPPPYGSPDNSPLIADGSNFPCKATSNSGGTVTNMAIGAPQKLSFLGESVHGGGSCQVSLTTDTPATKSSTWMVIHSIEGGCPAKNVAGNLGADNSATAPDPDTYSFSIPEGIAPGAYTLAWTWFNKVGNREMYMNCASVKVTGGSSKRDTSLNETHFAVRTPSFPAMFVANIPTTDCQTADSMDVQFPDPGTSVEKDGVASDLTAPTGPKCGASSGGSSSSGSSGSSSSGAQAAAPSGGSSAAAPAAPSVASPAAAAPSVAASPAPASPSTASTSGSSGSTCSSPGTMVCSSDGKQFAICGASGTAPAFQPVADGTSCTNGVIASAKSRRSAKFAPGYSG